MPYLEQVFGLSGGEWFIVVFITLMVVSARYWPALGERIAARLAGESEPEPGARPSAAPPRE